MNTRRFRGALAAVAALLAAHAAPAQPCPPRWVPSPNVHDDLGWVFSITEWDPDGPGPAGKQVVVSGSPLRTPGDPTQAASILRWDGDAWLPFNPTQEAAVGQLAIAPDGSLLALGFFKFNGGDGDAEDALARWTGDSWEPIAAANDSIRRVIVKPNGELIVGGRFTSINGVAANRVARFDGAQWLPIGGGITGPDAQLGVDVRDMVVMPNGDLVVSGIFTATADGPAQRIARWKGSQWAAFASGTTVGVANALTVLPNGDLVAGASGNIFQGVAHNGLIRWNGASWSPYTTGVGSGSIVDMLVMPNGDLVASGNFFLAGNEEVGYIARWDGSAWSSFQGGCDLYVYALHLRDNGELLAGGPFRRAGPSHAPGLAVWDGSAWSPIRPAMEFSPLALTLAADGTPVVAGDVLPGSNFSSVARFDGTAMSHLGTGFEGRIHSLTTAANGDTYAGGSFSTAGGLPANSIARWDGAAWSPLGSGLTVTTPSATIVNALATDPLGGIFAAGRFDLAGGQPALNVARWSGSAWSPLAGGLPGPVSALAVTPSGHVIAGGTFTLGACHNIARWDGAAWQPLDVGLGTTTDNIDALLALSDTDIIAAGTFTTAADSTP